ncbi:DUF6520 family protein [Flavobacterium sp. 1355]|uniref:DUF6520 family protein n=1 Tax=Flavobacterium sp. 1355 TaxID=2806571 RepID=UPI001AE1E3D6|nr:DUF6520 family protein [Flavobacterium sp. 1355]MBP1222348.1 hypothetical protein [Flavobacterium sp. 1355]
MNTIVKMILPAAVFILASAGAVSTKAAKESDAKKALTTEWIQISGSPTNCDDVQVNCTPVNTGTLCSYEDENSQEHQVFRKNTAGQCRIQLYKTEP